MKLPHKSNAAHRTFNLKGYKALIITTSQSTLDKIDKVTGEVVKKGKATGVYASEMTEPYYTFLDARMQVGIASISGGIIPIEKLSLLPLVRTKEDERFLEDAEFQHKVEHSIPIANVDSSSYDLIFLAGGWGAAYDFAQSDTLASFVSKAYASKKILGAVCHGPLGFIGAKKPDGSPLVKDVEITGVTNRQIKQLMVRETPKHPETELKNKGARYRSNSGIINLFQNNIVVDKGHLIVTGQNQKGATEAAQKALQLLEEQIKIRYEHRKINKSSTRNGTMREYQYQFTQGK